MIIFSLIGINKENNYFVQEIVPIHLFANKILLNIPVNKIEEMILNKYLKN